MRKNQQLSSEPLAGYASRLETSEGTNRDTKGLGQMRVGCYTVGSVGPINGEDGKEISDFVPTLHELKQLASYWWTERIEHNFDYFLYQQSGSSEWRWSVYISRRLNRLAEILGDGAMRQARDDAGASFRKDCPNINDEDWRVFTTGSEEEQEEWRTKHLKHLFPESIRATSE